MRLFKIFCYLNRYRSNYSYLYRTFIVHRHPPLGDYETEARASALKVAVIQFLATDTLTAAALGIMQKLLVSFGSLNILG